MAGREDAWQLFYELEKKYGLPLGTLDALWAQESGRGKNLLNESSQAAGHFQIIPSNYEAAGINPNDLAQSAEWTAMNARKAIDSFPNLNPVEAIAKYHYAGPDVKQWGPKTEKYAKDIGSRLAGARASLSLQQPPAATAAPVRQPMAPELANLMQASLAPVDMTLDPSQRSVSQSMSSNPWLQMGLGVLSQGGTGKPALSNIAAGAQQGILAADKSQSDWEAKQRQAMHDQLWQRQINNSILNTLGAQQPNPYELMTAQNTQNANQINAYRAKTERMKLDQPGAGGRGGASSATSDPSSVLAGIDETIRLVKDNPEAVGFTAPVIRTVGAFGNSVLDAFGIPTDDPTRKAWNEKTAYGTQAKVDFRLQVSVMETANWIVNQKGSAQGARITDNDVKNARRILEGGSWINNSTAAIEALNGLRDVVARVTGSSGTPSQSAPGASQSYQAPSYSGTPGVGFMSGGMPQPGTNGVVSFSDLPD